MLIQRRLDESAKSADTFLLPSRCMRAQFSIVYHFMLPCLVQASTPLKRLPIQRVPSFETAMALMNLLRVCLPSRTDRVNVFSSL